MKKFIFLSLVVLSFIGNAQILDPVKWEFESTKLSEDTYELTFTATIDEKWAIYSQFIEEGGPIPTTFTFEEGDYELIEKVTEADENKVTKHDPVFNMQVSKFYDKATFKQRVKLNNPEALVTGSLVFMTCDDARCLPPTDVPFEFDISNNKGNTSDNNQKVSVDNEIVNNLLYGMSPNDIQSSAVKIEQGKSLWSIFALGFIGGLLALLTPCVFPMIPLTVSFFTKSSSASRGSVNIE